MNHFQKWILEKAVKTKFNRVVQNGDFYKQHKRKDGTVHTMKPNIVSIRFHDRRYELVFKIPKGLNPKVFFEREFVLRQEFGENIYLEIKDSITAILKVYDTVSDGSYNYVFSEWTHLMGKCGGLAVIGGKDNNGTPYCYNMVENPHLLIAGETGSGKSVMLRVLLTGLIQQYRTGLRLHLIDLKRTEFFLFKNVDIVDSVLTKKNEALACVSWFRKQLEDRGDLFDQHNVEHIDKYNQLKGVQRLDYLVLCIDEFSVLRSEKEVLEALKDISALGRALGIFLILSTQRADRTIVEGLLKANLTVRYAFRHADKINSRITLGEGCKEDASEIGDKEKGKFIMRLGKTKTLQAPFLSSEEAGEILGRYKVPKQKKHSYRPRKDVSEEQILLGVIEEE